MPGGTSTTIDAGETSTETVERRTDAGVATDVDADRQRFTRACLIGVAVAAVPFLWCLWWDGRVLDPLHTAWPQRTFSNFYDLQARALFDGHWWISGHRLGIEAFVHDGREYMYFGPFSSFLRMPVLALTDKADGLLTAPSMLLAWCVAAIVVPLLLWRVRILLRGPGVLVSRAEATSVGIVVAVILGGSVFLHLASLPWVYHEDFLWSAALTTATLFALLGLLEQPSRGRAWATGLLTLATVLNRYPTGWGCVIAVGIAAVMFGIGRLGDEHRRWWKATAAAAIGPLVAGSLVTMVKFGLPFGLPMSEQVWTRLNEHRRDFLAANGGKAFSVEFIPSTALAYLSPGGIRFGPMFPFVGLPSEPAKWVGDVVLDQTYRTASAPATMPLLVVLCVWGLVVAFRPKPVGRARLFRVPLLGALAATTGVMLWGYIANRYLADFMPLLILGAAIGLVEVWRRLDGRSRRARVVAVGLIAAGGVFGMYANFAIANEPTDRIAWRGERVGDFVRIQDAIGGITGRSASDNIDYGSTFSMRLPQHQPAGKLYLVGYCQGLYLSIGEKENGWIAVDRSEAGGQRAFTLRMTEPIGRGRIPLITVEDRNPRKEPSVVWLEGDGKGRIRFGIDDRRLPTTGQWITVPRGEDVPVDIAADRALHEVEIDLPTISDDTAHFGWLSADGEQTFEHPRSDEFTIERRPVPPPDLCYELTGLDPEDAPEAET